MVVCFVYDTPPICFVYDTPAICFVYDEVLLGVLHATPALCFVYDTPAICFVYDEMLLGVDFLEIHLLASGRAAVWLVRCHRLSPSRSSPLA